VSCGNGRVIVNGVFVLHRSYSCVTLGIESRARVSAKPARHGGSFAVCLISRILYAASVRYNPAALHKRTSQLKRGSNECNAQRFPRALEMEGSVSR
jgi:hypothetical protein